MSAPSKAGPQIGDEAPDFTLETHTGEKLRLSEFRGRQVVVLFFYPRDNTPICTKQACAFRDAYEQFAEAGAAVVGISGNSASSHAGFAEKHKLPFHLAVDPGDRVRKLYGAAHLFGLIPGRATFVIDKQGKIRLIFRSLWTADDHVSEALTVVRELAGSGEGV